MVSEERGGGWVGFGGGYLRTSLFLNKAFNILLSLFLLVVCLPVFLLLYVLLMFRNGRPVFYKGTRLGAAKKSFTMYKFRTLVKNAEQIIGAEVLTRQRGLVAPMGKFLRESRLDELPQLINVLRGDMDFVGPRPVRPQIYERICQHIPNYDKRFQVSPGLVGYAQLFTPHSSPKRIRTLIDNSLVKKKQRFMWDAWAVGVAGFVVAKATLGLLARHAYRDLWLSKILGRFQEKRTTDRKRPARAWAYPVSADGQGDSCMLVDINEEAFLIRSSQTIEQPFPEEFTLHVNLGRVRGVRWKRARCTGKLYKEIKKGNGSYHYVIKYTPATPLNFYMVHQYFLFESMA
ncbi:MAG: sugar transferase [Lentisphaerae bacterium]|nr:sugar transferase [Lentisphaerota bacterium]